MTSEQLLKVYQEAYKKTNPQPPKQQQPPAQPNRK